MFRMLAALVCLCLDSARGCDRPPISLSQAHLAEIALRGVPVPAYDRGRLVPRIVHVGVGGFHRAHLALYVHELASAGGDWGIVGLGLLDKDAAMAAALRRPGPPVHADREGRRRSPSAAVIGSIVGFVHAPDGHDAAVAELVASRATSILSLTVTEAGYAEPSPEQLASGAGTTFDRLAAALAARRERAAGPLTILSCDNLPGNGDAARHATLAAAARADPSLPEWVQENCTFPNSMVDRITPVTATADREWLRDTLGIEDRWPVVAEPFRQWVMEDEFAGGPAAVGGRRRAVHRPHPRLGALQAAPAQRRALLHGVSFSARRHHVRARGDGDPARSGHSSKSSSIARPCPHSPRFPVIPGSSTSPPCWSGSRTRACATRSPACASTAARSSPAS